MLKCVLHYFDFFCLKLSENFNSFHFCHTVSYTSLHSNITDFLLTYHIRVSSLELYAYVINFYISGQWFVPHNQLLLCICYIGTAANLLFTKAPSSEFQECFGKVLYLLEVLQVHTIVILICYEWFGWLYTIWIWNIKTLLLSFHDCICPLPSPMIWLICSCHLCFIGFSFFFNIPIPHPPLHVAYCWNIVRTTSYQKLPVVTCRVKSWQRFFSIRGCSPLWFTIKRLPIFTYSWFHMPVTLSINYFNLFQNITVDGRNINWPKWNKCWIILFLSSCCQACCNLLDSGFC